LPIFYHQSAGKIFILMSGYTTDRISDPNYSANRYCSLASTRFKTYTIQLPFLEHDKTGN